MGLGNWLLILQVQSQRDGLLKDKKTNNLKAP